MSEVEKAIGKVTDGTVAYVVGIPDPDRGEVVAAVLVADREEFDESALRRELKSELSAYKIPRRFVALARADVPTMSSGKVDVQKLKSLFDV